MRKPGDFLNKLTSEKANSMTTEEELKKINERFFYASKACSHALWDWDAITGEAYVSPTFTEIFGWEADKDQRFEQWHQYIHPDDQQVTTDNYYKALENPDENIWEAEYRFLKADGSYAIVVDKAYILRDEQKKVVKVIGATEDITAKKRIEEELFKSNERFDIMLEATNELLWEWHININKIYRPAEGLRKVYGVCDNRSIETIEKWMSRIHPDDLPTVQKVFDDLLTASHRQTFEAEYRFKKDDGTYTHIYNRGILLKDESNKPVRMIGAAQNISQRKQLEQEILQNELEYKKLINQATVDSQEQQRDEIGRELHDNITQVLTTIKLYLELALSNEDMMKELVKKASGNVSTVINEVRNLSRSLMDPTIGDLGIVDSIKDLIESINATRKIQVDLLIDERIEALLNRNQKLTIFRIIQESLNNVLKHAMANFTSVQISCIDHNVSLQVQDDGIGFVQHVVKKGAGLNNISNRVYLVNGTLAIESAHGKGCRIKVIIPLQKSDQH